MIYNGVDYDISEEFSFKDFTSRKDLEIPNGTIVYGSCFSQEVPDTSIFSVEPKSVLFIKCNLDNVAIPESFDEPIDCSRKRFKVQNDLRDWEVDENDTPIKVISERFWEMQGLSVDPLHIPETKISSTTEIRRR